MGPLNRPLSCDYRLAHSGRYSESRLRQPELFPLLRNLPQRWKHASRRVYAALIPIGIQKALFLTEYEYNRTYIIRITEMTTKTCPQKSSLLGFTRGPKS